MAFESPSVDLEQDPVRPMALAGYVFLELMPRGVLIVDENRAISYRNAIADGMLKRRDGLLDRHGFIGCPTAAASDALSTLIRSLGLGGAAHDGEGLERAVMRLPGNDGSAGYLLLAFAVRPERTLGAYGDTPCAVLILHPLDTPRSLDSRVIGLAFGLTSAEAAIATAIAQGSTTEQVARERGVSLNTVRAQLRSVFEKVGVSRQTDLVRTVLELPRFVDSRFGELKLEPTRDRTFAAPRAGSP
jgi:DNA-binding CsgD family transcriptional regulator